MLLLLLMIMKAFRSKMIVSILVSLFVGSFNSGRLGLMHCSMKGDRARFRLYPTTSFYFPDSNFNFNFPSPFNLIRFSLDIFYYFLIFHLIFRNVLFAKRYHRRISKMKVCFLPLFLLLLLPAASHFSDGFMELVLELVVKKKIATTGCKIISVGIHTMPMKNISLECLVSETIKQLKVQIA